MKIDITGRHVDITPALREFVEEKLNKLEKVLDGPSESPRRPGHPEAPPSGGDQDRRQEHRAVGKHGDG